MNQNISVDMKKENLPKLRREYTLKTLDEKEVNKDPFKQFEKWFSEALSLMVKDANAMTLATVGNDKKPHARVVLLKEVTGEGFVFYTNYNSDKGREMQENPNAAICFYWPELERQVRIEGVVKKINRSQSEKYFRSRPYKSQIGALASDQSQEVKNRQELEARFAQLSKKYGKAEVPMPEWWGGYVLKPDSIEFWQGRESRLHDRVKYIANGNSWQIKRLSP